MKRSLKLGVGAALALTVALGGMPVRAAGTDKPADVKPAEAPNGIAAEVNGEKIMVADVNRLLERVRQLNPALGGDSDSAKNALGSLRGRILDDMINLNLMFQEARRINLLPPTADVDKVMATFKARFDNDKEFQENFKKEGVSVDYVRQNVTQHMAVDNLRKQWVADLVVAEDEITQFYKTNSKYFQLPATVRAQHILLSVDKKASTVEKAKVKAKADALLKQALKGADFAKLARENSQDPGSKAVGGELGYFAHEDMVPSFANAAFNTSAGKVTDHVVESEFGYHIIKVKDKQPAQPATLSDGIMETPRGPRMVRARNMQPSEEFPFIRIHDWVKGNLLEEKTEKRYNERLAALKEQAKIKKYL